MIRNLLALAGVLAIALLAAIGIQAYDAYDDRFDDAPPRIAVDYAGLDLAVPAGRRILERRINAAIADVCPAADGRDLVRRRYERECRENAIAGVRPQVAAAVDRAEARAARTAYAAPPPDYDPGPPPGYYHRDPLPAPEPAYTPPSPATQAPLRLVRRTTVTTTTVTRTRPAPPPPLVRKARPRPAAVAPRTGYGRRPAVPGSWLPPYAWREIERATHRAFGRGRTTHWAIRDRAGYVTVSTVRWIAGCKCRNVRAVKHAYGRQIVVAEGTRCRTRDGRLTGRP